MNSANQSLLSENVSSHNSFNFQDQLLCNLHFITCSAKIQLSDIGNIFKNTVDVHAFHSTKIKQHTLWSACLITYFLKLHVCNLIQTQ